MSTGSKPVTDEGASSLGIQKYLVSLQFCMYTLYAIGKLGFPKSKG